MPDLRGQFLRGIKTGYAIGQKVGNTLGRHNHTQPAHTHSFSGQLASTALSGTAEGQRYQYNMTWIQIDSPGAGGGGSGWNSADTGRRVYATSTAPWSQAQSSAVTGRLDNGRVNGTIGSGGGDPTDYTGGTETAPDHLYVRYLIRARQMPQ